MSGANGTPSASAGVASAAAAGAPKSQAELEKENQDLKLRLAALEQKATQPSDPRLTAAGQQAAYGPRELKQPVRFISRFRRYKPHLRQVTEDFGTHKSNRVLTAQFTDLTYLCEDAEIAELLRGMKQFRKEGDNRPGGEIWEMKPGENIRSAMQRLGIKDTGEAVHYTGAVDSRMAGQSR